MDFGSATPQRNSDDLTPTTVCNGGTTTDPARNPQSSLFPNARTHHRMDSGLFRSSVGVMMPLGENKQGGGRKGNDHEAAGDCVFHEQQRTKKKMHYPVWVAACDPKNEIPHGGGGGGGGVSAAASFSPSLELGASKENQTSNVPGAVVTKAAATKHPTRDTTTPLLSHQNETVAKKSSSSSNSFSEGDSCDGGGTHTSKADESSSIRNEIAVSLVIGEGAFGRVWFGYHKPTHTEIALKVVDKWSCRKRPELITAIRTEQTILKLLRQEQQQQQQQHPSEAKTSDAGEIICGNNSHNETTNSRTAPPPPPVVQLLASFHDSECLYLVMECHKGGTLEDMISYIFGRNEEDSSESCSTDQRRHRSKEDGEEDPRPRQPHQEDLEQYSKSLPWYAWQLFEAVQYLHCRGICHGDLKPANVLVSLPSGRLLLTDFGSATMVSSTNNNNNNRSTTTGGIPRRTIQGTTLYSAPELLLPQRWTTTGVGGVGDLVATGSLDSPPLGSLDLWSLGCILYELWCGESPFAAASEFLVMATIRSFGQCTKPDRRLWLLNRPQQFLSSLSMGQRLAHEKEERKGVEEGRQRGLPPVWLDLLHNYLLQWEPEQRMGGCGNEAARGGTGPATATKQGKAQALYPHLVAHPAWSQTQRQENGPPSFLPPEPAWVQYVRNKKGLSWRDGSLGWSAFLV